MSAAIDGFNVATSGTESARLMVGPATTYLDLGEGNGNYIRSGNATVVRVALWSHMRLNADNNGSAPSYREALPNYPTFEGFAQGLTAKCTRHVTAAANIVTTDAVVGQATPSSGSWYNSAWASNVGSVPFNTGGVWGNDANDMIQAPAWPGMTVASSPDPVNGTGLSASTTPITETGSLDVCFSLWEMIVPADNTLIVRKGLSRCQGTPAAIKSNMATVARSGARSAPPRVVDSGGNQMRPGDEGFITMTLTFANNDAKAFLAAHPYFLVQYGDAANAMYLIHAHAFVA